MGFGGNFQAVSGLGTLLQRGDGDEIFEVFSTIAQVVGITGPNIVSRTIDQTHIDSSGRFQQLLPTVLSAGPVQFSCNFLPSEDTQKNLRLDAINQVLRNFRLVWPDGTPTNEPGTRWEFSAYVSGYQPNASIDDRLTASIVLAITGEPEFNDT